MIKNHGVIWLRISDEEREGTWKDPDNKESLTFTNWDSGQPNNRGGNEHWGYMFSYDGKWGDNSDSEYLSYIVCELT